MNPVLTFSAALDASTVTTSEVHLRSDLGDEEIEVSVAGDRLSVIPKQKLLPSTRYQIRISDRIRGVDGEQLASAVQQAFTTKDGEWQPLEFVKDPDPAGGREQRHAAGAIDRQGRAVVIWEDHQSAKVRVWASASRADDTWDEPRLIDESSHYNVYEPIVGMDAQGNALALWNERERGIYSRRYDASSGAWEDELTRIDQRPVGPFLGDTTYPRMAVAADGQALAAWSFFTLWPQPGFRGTFTARYGASGWEQPALLPTSDIADKEVRLNDDAGVVAWTFSNQLLAASFAGGTGDAEVTQLNADGPAGTPVPGARLALGPSGRALVVWNGVWNGALDPVWFNVRGENGQWGTPAAATDGLDVQRVEMDARGNAMVVGLHYEDSRTRVRALPYYARENVWGEAIDLDNEPECSARDPQVAVDRGGNALVVWRECNFREDETWFSLWARRYRPSEGWGEAVQLDEQQFVGAATIWLGPQIAINSSGDAIAVWATFFGVRAARFR